MIALFSQLTHTEAMLTLFLLQEDQRNIHYRKQKEGNYGNHILLVSQKYLLEFHLTHSLSLSLLALSPALKLDVLADKSALWSESCSGVTFMQKVMTLCDPIDYEVHEILQARILEWIAFPFSRIFPTQGSNPGLWHCRWILYQLTHRCKLDAVLLAQQSLLSSKIFPYDSDVITSRSPGGSFLNPRILVSILLYCS